VKQASTSVIQTRVRAVIVVADVAGEQIRIAVVRLITHALVMAGEAEKESDRRVEESAF
jgi:hypothetical protein